jgi:hypothetical protein
MGPFVMLRLQPSFNNTFRALPSIFWMCKPENMRAHVQQEASCMRCICQRYISCISAAEVRHTTYLPSGLLEDCLEKLENNATAQTLIISKELM